MDPVKRFLVRRSAVRSLEVSCWALGVVLLIAWAVARVSGELERRAAIADFPVMVPNTPAPAAPGVRLQQSRRLLEVEQKPNQALWSMSRRRAYVAAVNAPTADADASTVEAILRIPRVGLEVPVYSRIDELNLNRGAGLIANTASPGSNGNVAIAAHRDGYFRVLKDVEPGDVLELQTVRGVRKYTVSRTFIVAPTDVTLLAPTAVPSLTLVTCYPFYFVGPAPQRYIVRAVAKASNR